MAELYTRSADQERLAETAIATTEYRRHEWNVTESVPL